MSSYEHDLIVIGGGPAGSTCARFAARSGLDVVVFERTGRRPVTRTSAGIFDHTWRALDLAPAEYPHAMRTPHAFDFTTLKDREPLPDVLRIAAPFLKRHVYFPNRDEFDTWLLFAGEQDRLSARDIADPRIDPTGTGGWVTVNLRGAWQFRQDWSLALRIGNIFDRQYREHGSGIDAPGLDAALSLGGIF